MHGSSEPSPLVGRGRLGSPVPHKKARLEIIPLIHIMFFLLACFMLVSLSMINMKSIKVNLPTAVSATIETKSDFVSISVDRQGNVFLDKRPVGKNELRNEMVKLYNANKNTRVFISGDKDALHGDMVTVLDAVRASGIDKVAFEIRSSGGGAAEAGKK